MENSGQEALVTGVNVSIFIIALTIGITLLTTVLSLAEIANEDVVKASSGGVMVVNDGDGKRIVTGADLMNYYSNYTNNSAAYQESKDDLFVKIGAGQPQDLNTYIESIEIKKDFFNTKFELIYDGIDTATNKEKYVFTNPVS